MSQKVLRLLKNVARPLLLPVLQRFGWRTGREKPPRITAGERLQSNDVPTQVTVREDRTLLVNGEPFFPIGLYYARTEIEDASGDGLKKLKAMGFNVLFFDGDLNASAELDRIWSAGLYVWYRPPGQLYRDYETLRRVVSKFARHPALLFWEMDDEPVHNGVSLAQTTRGCRVVRQLDPFHPILCNQWLTSLRQGDELRRWAKLADVHGFAVYPLPLSRWRERMQLVNEGWPHDISVVGRQAGFWRSLAPRKPVIPILQAHAPDSIEDGAAGFPTHEQARFMVYQAVIHGANGLHHFGDVSAGSPNLACGIPPRFREDLDATYVQFVEARRHNAAFWHYYARVVAEIACMAVVFTARDAEWPDNSVRAVSGPAVEWRAKRHPGGDVLLIVNPTELDVTVEIDAARWRGKPVRLWGEDRTLSNSFRERIGPYGVRIVSDHEDLLKGGLGEWPQLQES